jgi:hypothetical protein
MTQQLSGALACFVCILVIARPASAQTPFNQVFLKATHNSYANTPVGTIRHQLDSGCRIIELDIYDTQLATAHDFIIGHAAPGNDVHLGDGNPETPALSKWLKLINHWSDAHLHHAPIVLYFDLKNGSGFNNGSLALLDEEVARIFGKKFYPAWQYPGTWPSIDSLRGKVMTVLTGGLKYRTAYRWDQGDDPCVAMNSRGQVVEVHGTSAGFLWYWIGEYQRDGTVAWRRHGKLGPGMYPAVAINKDGWIVEVHMPTDTSTQLLYSLGHLDKAGNVRWFSPHVYYETGADPTVGFDSSLTLSAVHESLQTDLHCRLRGRLYPAREMISWESPMISRDIQPLPRTRCTSTENRWISVSTAADTVARSDTLRYSTPTVHNARLTYEQRSFVEYDMGDPLLNSDGLLFYTAPFPSGITWGRAARQADKIVRLWMFNKLTPVITAGPPPANYPATDYPYAPWYDHYMQSLHPIH